MATDSSAEHKSLDATIAAVLITATAYAAAFAYESTFLTHFGVPNYLVEVELRSLLLCLVSLIGVFIITQMVLTWWPASWPAAVNLTIIQTSLLLAALISTGIAFKFKWFGWVFLTAVALFMLYLFYVAPINMHKDQPTYAMKLKASWDAEVRRENAADWIGKQVGRKRFLFALLALLSCFLAALVGSVQAHRMRDFLVNENCIVLRVRGDLALCSEFEGQTLTGRLRFIPANEVVLKTMRIGPIEEFRLRPLDARDGK